MSLRIRSDGRVLCAATHAAEPGDLYVDDGLHYYLSVEAGVLTTDPEPEHSTHGEWWWRGADPTPGTRRPPKPLPERLERSRWANTKRVFSREGRT